MKELSIEEKAKAYDEALKVLHKYDGANIMFSQSLKEEMFPELKESEDERIRKALIHIVKGACSKYGIKYQGKEIGEEKLLAWLEKQSNEPNWCHHKVDLSNCSDEYRKAYYDGWNNCNQQHEQLNPTPMSIDEAIKHCKEKSCGNNACALEHKQLEKWLIELKELKEQKPTWSEEDEQYLLVCKNALAKYQTTDKWDACIISQWLEDRFKSLRPQINVTDEELAQAKKEAYNEALNKIEYHSGEPTFDDGWSAAIWYLKKRNGRPQNTWKPSAQQMISITCAVRKMKESACYDSVLVSLFNDLKKLREK